MMEQTKEIYQQAIENYRNKTPKSEKAFNLATNVMPGGETRSICFFEPYPLTINKAKGAYIYDIDGNRYIDFLNNYTAMIHGHSHDKINNKVQEAVKKGTAYAATIPEQIEFANLLCSRIPSVEKVRFCNSGTEATMFAIRAARAFTNKSSIIKINGSYHGTHDLAIWENDNENNELSKNISEDIFTVPFNDVDAIEKILSKYHSKIAAILVEPVMGVAGVILPKENYLSQLRELADKYNVILIFDEVQTLRLAVGGAQEFFNVTPDLTCMAKIIGGGFPVGAFGGKKEIMDMFDPRKDNFLAHGGTFNGNKVTMSAGIAAMQILDEEEINKMNSLATQLVDQIKNIIKNLELPISLTHVGSMINIHFTKQKPNRYEDTLNQDKNLIKIIHLKLLNRGIFIAPRGLMNLSTVMTQEDIDETVNVFTDVLNGMKTLLNK